MKQNAPTILVFDSGIGGLSIYNEIYKSLPNLNYIYLFDNEMFPYGDKDSEYLITRVNKVFNAVAKKYQIQLAVIACNTASTVCLPSLRATFSFPIVGVVPAIKPARKITKNNCIGLLATKATISRDYTKNLIKEYANDCKVELLGLSELALIAERKLQGESVNIDALQSLLQPWLNLSIMPDTIVLGCTHYPFIKEELQSIFVNATFVDSGYAIASRVKNLLLECNLLNSIEIVTSPPNQKKYNNLVLSTRYNQYIENTLLKLNYYDIHHYQLIEVSTN